MGSVLISMPKNSDANSIAEMLNQRGMLLDTEVCNTAAEILRIANSTDFGVVICTKKLRDMSSIELEEYLPPYFGMIVLTSDLSLETYSEKTVKLQMPFKVRELMTAIEAISSTAHTKLKKSGSGRPKRSLTEQRIIDEAKELLMSKNGMTEPEAFRYIQKNSMDSGRSLLESARMVIALNG